MDTALLEQDKKILLETARESIASQLENRMPQYTDDVNERLQEQCGVFVTLHIDKKLRGCIGTMRGTEPLIDAVKDMARSSAFHF